jgi:putative peptidoglycan lipid II flippase
MDCHGAAAAPLAAAPAETTRVTRAAAVVALATVLSRVLGYVRDGLIAAYFGAGFSSDAFLAAFRIPNLFRRLVGEGAMNSAFVPVFSETLHRRGSAEAGRLFGSACRLFLSVLVPACALGIVAAGWMVPFITPGFSGPKLELTVTLTRWMFPYLFAAGMLALWMGALNVYGSFAPPALAPILLSLCMIGALTLLSPQMDRPEIGLAVGVLIGGVAQLLFQVPYLFRYRLNFRPSGRGLHPAISRMARMMVPSILGGGVYQINILAATFMASLLAEGSVSYLYYADRLVQFPLGVVAMAGATAALPSMAREAALGNSKSLCETFALAFRLVSFATIPAMVGLALLGESIVALLFMRGEFRPLDARLTASALSYYALGLWAFATLRIAVAAFFALQDSKTPMVAATISILANILLGLILMKPLAHGGVALATSVSAILNLGILLVALHRKMNGIDWRSIGSSLARSIVSAAMMALGISAIARFLLYMPDPSAMRQAASLGACIASGIFIYLTAGWVAGCIEIREVLAQLKRSRRF